MRYVKAGIMIAVAVGMIAEMFTQTVFFYGVGVGMLLLLACESIAEDSVR